jgi:hypothetical protein
MRARPRRSIREKPRRCRGLSSIHRRLVTSASRHCPRSTSTIALQNHRVRHRHCCSEIAGLPRRGHSFVCGGVQRQQQPLARLATWPVADSRKAAGGSGMRGLSWCRPIRANESAALRYAARPTLGGKPSARPRWCDQIPTPAENQLYPYSEHSCAHRRSHDFGKLFGD